jgi:hypothetical protein
LGILVDYAGPLAWQISEVVVLMDAPRFSEVLAKSAIK